MKLSTSLFLIVFAATPAFLQAQSDTPLYGLSRSVVEDPFENFEDHALYLMQIDPVTGVCTKLSDQPVGDLYALNGLSTVNAITGEYYFMGGTHFHRVDVETGDQSAPVSLTAPDSGSLSFLNFNAADTTTYGIYNPEGTFDSRLVRVIPETGTVEYISAEPIDALFGMSAMAAIDPFNSVMYAHSANKIILIDLASGEVTDEVVVSVDMSESVSFLRFNPADSLIYGIHSVHAGMFEPDVQRLCTVDPVYGIQFVGGESEVLEDYYTSLEGLATIDPYNEVYYITHSPVAGTVHLLALSLSDGSIMHDEVLQVEEGLRAPAMIAFCPGEIQQWAFALLSTDETETGVFKVYPNPSRDRVWVERESLTREPYFIFDLTGRVVNSGMLESRHTEIDLSALPEGIYLMRTAGETARTAKIIRN